MVEGNFSCQGDARGSVVLGSGVGSIHPITSAVLCEGTVTIPHGILPGTVLDEIPVLDGDKPKDELVSASTGLFAPLLEGVAPNLAKIEGPFHWRFPYIARYASTLTILSFKGIPLIPVVAPMQWPNFHVPVFRGLSYLYAPTLNFELGENLLTHADWWGLPGEGRVPMLTKPEVLQLARIAVGDYSLQLTNQFLRPRLDQRSKQVGEKAVMWFALECAARLRSLWAKAISESTGIKFLSWGTVLSKAFAAILSDLDKQEQALEAVVPDSSWKHLEDQITAFWVLVDRSTAGADLGLDNMAQECPGALIYAGGNLNIGTPANQSSVLACGWFVASGDVILNCTTVGSVISLDGLIRGKSLYFYPPFTRASLFLPQQENADWLARGKQSAYGARLSDSRPGDQKTFNLGLRREHVSAQAWETTP